MMAQSVLKGRILDKETKQPLPLAVIRIQNSNIYASSTIDGKFKIKISKDNLVQISHIGYKTIQINLKDNMVILLQENPINLDNIIVNAHPLEDISHAVQIIDYAKEVSQPRSVGDLFRDIKGFGIQKRGAYAADPVFRAFKDEDLNVQYDGGMKTVNACPNRMDPITTHVIPEEIKEIEIVKGPFTVRFGPNFGGIINMVSKIPSRDMLGFGGSVEGGYDSNGNNLITRTSMQYVKPKFDMLVNGEYKDYGNYKDGNGAVVPSSFRTTDYSVKTGYNFTNKQRLQFILRESFASDIKYAGLPMDAPYDNSYLTGFDYKIKQLSKKISDFSVKAYYSHVSHFMTNKGRANYMMVEAATKAYSTTYGGKIAVSLIPTEKSMVFLGIDFTGIKREGNRNRLVKIMNGIPLQMPMNFVDKVWQDGKNEDLGIFAESKYYITSHTTLTTGIRSDFVNASISDPATDFELLYGGTIPNQNDVNLSGNVSLKYNYDGFQTQLAIGRGVRSASMIERYINHWNVGIDPYEYVGNPFLKPEVNNQIELSFKKHYQKFNISADFFYSYLQNYITAIVDPSIHRKFRPMLQPQFAKRYVNTKKASQKGLEFSFDYSITHHLKFKVA